MKTRLALLGTILTVGIAAAQDKPDTRTPLERYQGDGTLYVGLCQLKVDNARRKASLNEFQDSHSDWRGCIDESTDATKKNFQAAMQTVRKPKTLEALKSYHAVLIAGIDGAAPGPDERKIDYDRRQQATATKLKEAWVRFEVEQ